MLFDVHGIKQVDGNSVQFDLLIESPDEQELRELGNELGIVILGIKFYDGEKKVYGNIFVQFSHKEKNYEIITKFDKIKDGYHFASDVLGGDVTYLNSYSDPTDENKIFEILSQLNSKKSIQKGIDKEEERQKVQVDDKVVQKMRKLITETIDEGQILLDQIQGVLPLELCKRFTSSIDKLKKFRISNNLEKMAEAYEEIILTMEEAEILYVEKMKGDQKIDLKNFMISDLDIVKEYEKFKTSKKAIKGSKISSSIKLDKDNKFYQNFGKNGVYFKLFFLDVYKKIENKSIKGVNIFDYIDLLIIFILIEMNIFIIYSQIMNFTTYIKTTYYYISFFGFLGLIMLFANKYKKPNLQGLIISIIIGFVAFFLLRYLIKLTFAI